MSDTDEEDDPQSTFFGTLTALSVESDDSDEEDFNCRQAEDHKILIEDPGLAYNWKDLGFKARNAPLEAFLKALNLPFLIGTVLDAGITSVSILQKLPQESAERLLLSLGATPNDVHKILSCLVPTERLKGDPSTLSSIAENPKEENVFEEAHDSLMSKPCIEWTKKECLSWLENVDENLGLDLVKIEQNDITGRDLIEACNSTRELVDIFGLKTCAARVQFENLVRTLVSPVSASSRLPSGTQGGIYSVFFLSEVQFLYDIHMGVENMAPLLYTLVRFLKVKSLLEVGAGYTSVFLLQALSDNDVEAKQYERSLVEKKCTVDGQPWCVRPGITSHQASPALLHCVDHMGHAHTTANQVAHASQKLNLEEYLVLHDIDFWDFELKESVDFIWLDFAAGDKLDQVFQKWWPHLQDGGYVLCHSTLTNTLTRNWLEKMRGQSEKQVDSEAGGEEFIFHHISFLEPFKMFQNSFSIFQKRSVSYMEPVLTRYP